MGELLDEAVESETVVRTMRESDLEPIIDIDAAASGRRRPEYFRLILERTLHQSAMQVSLVAESSGRVAGFLIASVYYGEFGLMEPSASIESVGVAGDVRRKRVAHDLMQQLRSNLAAIGVDVLRTEVDWSDLDLLGFFRSEGFAPAPRLCLEARVREK